MGNSGLMGSLGSSVANNLGFNFGGSTSNGTPTLTTVAPGAAIAGNVPGNSAFQTVTANLTGIRASLFSPTFGVLSSLTKLVSAAGGSSASSALNSALSSSTANVLRDVTSIASLATTVVGLTSSGKMGGNVGASSVSNIQTSLNSMKNTSGIIGSAPTTIVSTLGKLVTNGAISAATPFLASAVGSVASLFSSNSSSNTTSSSAGIGTADNADTSNSSNDNSGSIA
jgi:hypothetical protein